jgi:hypothetical protein
VCLPVKRRALLGLPALGVVAFVLGLRDAGQRASAAQTTRIFAPVAVRGGSVSSAPTTVATATPTAPASPVAGGHFTTGVTTRTDDKYLYVGSDGLPAHQVMVGIKSWQQQVPVPQSYSGSNTWPIPRYPVLSDAPISARTGLYTGAIAIAANGIPIFNALNNRGDDAYLSGELDNWGGHAGRADDYHYHTAPVHLQDLVGAGNPIGFALDGFALYGLNEPDGSAVGGLDQYNGHSDSRLGYHYHATTTYPYLNGGLRGVVTVQNDQVVPQAATAAFRPPGSPLAGATVTDWNRTGTNAFSLAYTISGQTYRVNYRLETSQVVFEFVDPSGHTTSQSYPRSI